MCWFEKLRKEKTKSSKRSISEAFDGESDNEQLEPNKRQEKPHKNNDIIVPNTPEPIPELIPSTPSDDNMDSYKTDDLDDKIKKEEDSSVKSEPHKKRGRPRKSGTRKTKESIERIPLPKRVFEPNFEKAQQQPKFGITFKDQRDWIETCPDIKLNEQQYEPEEGYSFAEKTSASDSICKEILDASTQQYGFRIWGRRIIPKLEYYRYGDHNQPPPASINSNTPHLLCPNICESGGG